MTKQDRSASTDKIGKRFALAFIIGLSVLYMIWTFAAEYPRSARVAAIGGTIAFYGVIVMSIPILREGPFQWITNTVFKDVLADFGETQPEYSSEQRRMLADHEMFDLILQNVFGPYFVGVGTIVNAFSGFF